MQCGLDAIKKWELHQKESSAWSYMSVWDITENDLQKSLFLHYGQKLSSFKKCIGRVFLGVFKILEKYNLRERWKQVSEILERWKQVFRNLREIFPKSSFQNLREIVISERWKQIPEILERWKQVPEIACNITHDYYSL